MGNKAKNTNNETLTSENVNVGKTHRDTLKRKCQKKTAEKFTIQEEKIKGIGERSETQKDRLLRYK